MPRAKKVTKVQSNKGSKRLSARVASTSKSSPQERAEKVTTNLNENIKKPKVFISVVILILLIFLFFFRSLFVVAIVNGQLISRMQYEQILQAQSGKQVMSSLVTKSLLEQEASRRHMTVNQSEVDSQIRTIQSQLASQGQTLDTALSAQGLSKDNFMQQLKLQILVQKMLKDKTTVSDSEVSDYISKNQSSLPSNLSDAQMKAQVRQQLSQQKLSQEAQLLIQSLQSKAKVTYFINL